MQIKKRRDIIRGLKRKGFIEIRERDHIVLRFYSLGEYRGIRTKVSHGSKSQDVDKKMISLMAGKCRVTKQQFIDLVDCSISEAQYSELVRDQVKEKRS